jgi:rhodanese-related sulfurtransferase
MTGSLGAIPAISVADVAEARERAAETGAPEPVLLDVRNPDEFERFRIAGAALMPMASIMARYRELPADRPIHVICHSGNRSAAVAQFLVSAGYRDVANVTGGMVAWVRAGLPAISGPPAAGEGELRP